MDKEISQKLYDFCDSKEKDLKAFVKDMQEFLPYLKEKREMYMLKEDDYRSGWETYAYKDKEYIIGQLEYISDRWGAAFRINWLIGLLDPYDYMHASEWEKYDYQKLIS